MSEATRLLLSSVLSLPEAERQQFVQAVLNSFPKPPTMLADDDPAFEAELDRRITEYEAGRSQPIPGKEFFQRLREKAS